MAARQAVIVGGRRMGRRIRIKSEPKWEGISQGELKILNFGDVDEKISDLPLIHSQMNTIVCSVSHSYTHYYPFQKVKRGMNNKNMRRYHRVHQPGFDTQRRPIKN